MSQCDHMARIFFQVFAIYSYENLPNRSHKNWPKEAGSIFCQKLNESSGKISPNTVTLICENKVPTLGTFVLKSNKLVFIAS